MPPTSARRIATSRFQKVSGRGLALTGLELPGLGLGRGGQGGAQAQGQEPERGDRGK
jgi:hypothetical protein